MSTPTLSASSNGFWWLWHEGEWEPVETRVVTNPGGSHLTIRYLKNRTGAHATATSMPQLETWGGRITPPAPL